MARKLLSLLEMLLGTQSTGIKQNSMTVRRLFNTIVFNLLCTGLIIVTGEAKADKYQSLESILFQAEEFVMQYGYNTPYLPAFSANKLDTRLRLKACPERLDIEFSNRQKTSGSASLNIGCEQPPGWSIHLPVKIDVFDDVLVTSQPLSRGQNIDDNGLQYAKKNISLLNQGYFTQANDLKHMESRQNLKRGSVLTPTNTRPSIMVKSGQNVTLTLNYKGISIKSSGQALNSARIGQIVKVRNLQSRKIVEGIVSGEGQVKVHI
ncbi:MAG: flagella basal body P-ring formation protein FlgA [Gammaproteobacteria bacterium]|jgi:flagella basal body P-ring formation protein FlgA